MIKSSWYVLPLMILHLAASALCQESGWEQSAAPAGWEFQQVAQDWQEQAQSQPISAIDTVSAMGLPTLESSLSPVQDEVAVPRFKKQAIQKISFAGGWLGSTGPEDLSATHASAGITFGVPLGNMENILAVTPSFRVDWLNASTPIQVPNELFDVGLDLFHTRRISQRWKFLALVRPSLRSDFKTKENAVRVFGLGLFLWEYQPDVLTVSLGAVYLGRSDISVLPAVGLTWTPNKQSRFELQFPRSRIMQRLRKDGANSELWAYLNIGIGGNTWAVTLPGDQADEVALRDIRLTAGIEKIVAGGGGWFLETGLAMDRSIEYLSNRSTRRSLSNAIILAGGWSY